MIPALSGYNSNNNNNEDSLGSINLSNDEVILQHAQLQKMESRRNTIDISSIDEISEHDDNDEDVEQWHFYKCLEKMVEWGFFTQSNFSNIKKLVDISKSLENP